MQYEYIDEFYVLLKRAREYLIDNIEGFTEAKEKKQFVDTLIMQMLTLWYLQKSGFFNNDTNYFINNFEGLINKKDGLKGDFDSYYRFLTYFFERVSNNTDEPYYFDDIVGRLVVVKPAIFISIRQDISIPDKCFYQKGVTELLINNPGKKINHEIPLLNLFESMDRTGTGIDEFVIGAIYEKLMNYREKKHSGAYYTPEELTQYICKNTIEPYIIENLDKNVDFSFKTIEQAIERGDQSILISIFQQLKAIKILDPAAGSGHFLESAMNALLNIYEKLWKKFKELHVNQGLTIEIWTKKGAIEEIELLDIKDVEVFRLFVKFFIILPQNIYGMDLDPLSIKIARARLFLGMAKHFKADSRLDRFVKLSNVHMNLKAGNSIIGYVNLDESGLKRQRDFEKGRLVHEIKRMEFYDELMDFLNKATKGKKIDGLLNKMAGVNKTGTDWNIIEMALKVKKAIIQVLAKSPDPQFSRSLNMILMKITDVLRQKLDEVFAKENKITPEELKKIKTFHWFVEFPEVFLDQEGFDVVVGNPPYGKLKNMDLNKQDKRMLSRIYKAFYKKIGGNIDYYKLFLERGIRLVRTGGYYSFLIPIMFWGDRDSYNLRKLYWNKRLCKVLHIPLDTTIKLFRKGITYEVSVFILKNVDMTEKDYDFVVVPDISVDFFKKDSDQGGFRLSKNYIHENSRLLRLPLFKSSYDMEILDYLKRFKSLGRYDNNEAVAYILDGKLHETNHKIYLSAKPTGELAVASKHVKDWLVDLKPEEDKKRWIIKGDEFRGKKLNKQIAGAKTVGELMDISPKIVGRQMANRAEKKKLHFALLKGNYILTNGVKIIILKKKYSFKRPYLSLLALLNSNLMDWRFQIYSTTYNVKSYEPEELPIVELNEEVTDVLSILAEYMLFIRQYQYCNKKGDLNEVMVYFQDLLNLIVHELYFK